MSSRGDVERIVDMFFRRFRVPALFLANPWVMALMANGNLTGLVMHVGDTACCVAPMLNVRTIEEGVRCVSTGVTDLLTESGKSALVEVSGTKSGICLKGR